MASNNQANLAGGKHAGSPGASQGASGISGSSNRGFVTMDPERQREIASEGGKVAHESGNAPELTSGQGHQAGRHGAEVSGGSHSSSAGGASGGKR